MDMQSMKSGSGKVVSVALAVALGSMGVAPAAIASTSNLTGGASEHSTKALKAGETFTYGSEVYGELSYVVNDDDTTVTCMGLADPYGDTPDNLIVPSVVFDDKGDGYTVTRIEKSDEAFFGLCGSISCTISSTVCELGYGGLEGGYCDYYFLGSRPTYEDDSSSFDYLFNDSTSIPNVYALASNMEIDNSNGYSWKDIQEEYETVYAGLGINTFAAPTTLSLDQTSLSLAANATVDLVATNVFDGDESDALDIHKTITWSSSSADVATVDSDGTVTAVADGTATITATNVIGATAACTITVGNGGTGGGITDPGEGEKVDIVTGDVIWAGLDNTQDSLPDQELGELKKPSGLQLWFENVTRLCEDTDYKTYFEDFDGNKVTEATTSGTYYFVVEGIGSYEGVKKFSFKVAPSSLEFGDWKYVDNGDGTVTVTGYASNFTPNAHTEATLPSEIDGKAVTGIGTGAFTGRMGALHVPDSVKTVASGAFDEFWCNYVIFEGNCPVGPDDAIKYRKFIPGIFYAQGTEGWTPSEEDGSNWASIHNPSSYDPNWVMEYTLNDKNQAEWHVAGYKGSDTEVTIPSMAFGSDKVTAIDKGAFANAANIKKLIVPSGVMQVADNAVTGLTAGAVIDFQGAVPKGTSYVNEFQLADGQSDKVKITFLPDYASAWKASQWVTSGAYDTSEYDIYTCNPADYIYTPNEDGSYTICAYRGNESVIRLPSHLDGLAIDVFNGEYKKNEDGSTSPVLESTTVNKAKVTALDANVFGTTKPDASVGISKISIPATIKSLGDKAFMQCQLSSIVFEEGSQLETIGSQCFWMSTLPSIELPASVTEIGKGAFFDEYLSNIAVDEGSEAFASQGGVLFSKDMETLVAYPSSRPASADKSYTVPSNVKHLEAYSFATTPGSTRPNLTSLKLNDGLEELGDCVFQNLRWITDIELPDTVKKMGVAVFNSADELKTVKMPKSFETIPNSTFQFCHNLEAVTLPKNLKKIEADAFLECNGYNFTKFEIPEGVEEIGSEAFRQCYQLREVTFPSTLKSVGEGAFVTTKLEKFDGAKTNIEHIGQAAFADNGNLKSVTLPKTLKTMDSSAFSTCENLSSVTIPEEMPLAEVPENTFVNCESLESITIPSNIKKIGARSFFGCHGLKSVYFLNPGTWELGDHAFFQKNSDETSTEIMLPDVVAYGYSKSSTPGYVEDGQIASFKPLDIVQEKSFESGMQATVGKLFELNGLCTTEVGQLSYQWYLGNEKVSGATSFKFSFTPESAGMQLLTLEVTSSINPNNPMRFSTFITVNSATSGGGSGSGGSTGGGSSSGGGSGSGGSGGSSSGSGSGGSAVAPTPGTDTSDKTDVSQVSPPSISGDFAYTGHPVKPSVTITYNGRTLVDGVDYIVSYKNNTKPGIATMIIEGFGEFTGRIEKTFTIDKLEQKLHVKTKTRTLSATKLKKKSRTVTCITGTSGAEGKLSFKKLSGKKALKVNSKTGKVTFAKGSKRGTYTAQIEVSASSTYFYEEASKIVTVSLKVK